MSAATQTKQAWTPGPWEVRLHFGFPEVVGPTTGRPVASLLIGGGIKELRGPDGDSIRAEIAANARLIAAAPEMADALLFVVNQSPVGRAAIHEALAMSREIARSVLRKAGGVL